MLLAALPLVALPVIIHLINQRRYQTIRWAAMLFLLAANRMSRGYARLRQWLIMAFRMAAIAALVFAVSRPLAGGWLGLAGGNRPETTLIVLDRSPSMQQAGVGGGGSKLETGRRQLVRMLETLGSGRWVLIDSGTAKPREIASPQALLESPDAEPVDASADLPALLTAAHDYIRDNKTGRTDIWICSDLRANDWNAESGRWQNLRDGFLELARGVRFHLLAYPETSSDDLAVRVTSVRRLQAGEGAELLVSLRIDSAGGGDARQTFPVHFEIDGARSELTVEMAGRTFELKDHRIPLARSQVRGWGRVSIPADANPADNDDWFVYDEPPPRHTVVVSEDVQAVRPLQLAAAISPDPAVKCSAEVLAPDQLGTVEWEKVALILWQAPLPDGEVAKTIRAMIERGGRILFLPPRDPSPREFLGAKWTTWNAPATEVSVENWRSDQDLLASTQSGASLPVGELHVRRYCGLSGEFTTLATLRGGAPLLSRVTTNAGGIYFCTTTPSVADSSLSTGGIVLYVLVQRALEDGAKSLGSTRHLTAGEPMGENPSTWKRIAGSDGALSTDYALHGGIYGAEDHLLAVSRSRAEDLAPPIPEDQLAGLFHGLDFSRVDDRAGSLASLIQEIWRLFLVSTMVAMVVEAGLCLPRPRPAGGAA
jgi:hypothetical protein